MARIRTALPHPELPRPDPGARLDAEVTPLDAFDALGPLDEADLRVVFQPIVWLRDGSVAAVEAFIRGPTGSPIEAPLRLFEAARAAHRVADVDRACVRHALAATRSRGLEGMAPVIVNVTGASLEPHAVRELAAMRDGLGGRTRLLLDIAEPDVARDPLGALAAAIEARRHGLGIALDDVGPGTTTLPLLALLRPDVVRLDVAQLRTAIAVRQATVVAAVGAYAEATGAVVVAERVETRADHAWAVAAGAGAVQGLYVDAPRALIDLAAPVTPVALLRDPPGQAVRTPFELVQHQGDVRRSSVAELVAMSRHLERWAGTDEGAAVLAAVDRAGAIAGRTAAAYADLATRAPLVALFGPGVGSQPAPGASGVPVRTDDALRDEWAVVVIGAQRTAALLARRADDGDGYDAVVTYRRDVAVQAARLLLARLTADRAPGTSSRSGL